MDTTSDSPEPASGGRRRIGDIFVALGFVTGAQLEAALDVQRRTGARIGEILVEQGSLTRLDLASALAEHWEPRSFEDDDRPGDSPSGAFEPNQEQACRAEADYGGSFPELERRLRAVELSLEVQRSVRAHSSTGRHLRREAPAPDALKGRLDGVEDRLAGLGRRVGEIEASLERLSVVRDADATAVEAALSSSRSAIEALTVLEQRVGSPGGHDDSTHAAAESVEERVTAEVAELARRLDAQASVAEEQARLTEEAVRAGLASLGKRLIGLHAKRAKPGKRVRRSLDRLGAAIVEADARLGNGIPSTDAEGYLVFAPTINGYRLVQRDGKLPKVGATVEWENVDGRLVVVRHGRSPLPFDDRTCAYLDHI